MVLCTYHTTISEAPTTLSMTTLRLMAFCKPNTSASYSSTMFVHSNSKQLDTRCFLLQGMIRTHRAPEPYCTFDPSKYIVHNSSVHRPLDVLALLLLLLLLFLLLVQFVVKVSLPSVGQGRHSYCASGGVGASCVEKHPNVVSKRQLSDMNFAKANVSFLTLMRVTLCFMYLLDST